MTYHWLVKRDGLYYWRSESCWGGSTLEEGGYASKQEALRNRPFGVAGNDWDDMTGEPEEGQ